MGFATNGYLRWKTLFFVSDREGGYGGYDLYKTKKMKMENGVYQKTLGLL